MLAIRMQRVGRTGNAQFRVVVQDRRFSPKSGRVVSYVGHYNPHSKKTVLNKDKIESYLANGAVPSGRVVLLLQKEGIKLPAWVVAPAPRKKSIKNPDKLRRNRPAGAPAPEPTAKADEVAADGDAEAGEAKPEEPATEGPAAETEDAAAEAPTEEQTAEQTPAEDATPDKPEEKPEPETEAAPEQKEELAAEAEAPAKSEPETATDERADKS